MVATIPLSPLGDRLLRVLPPALADGPATSVAEHLDLVSETIRSRLDLLNAWRDRLPLLPDPPATDSLQELIQQARRRVRQDRADVDAAELAERLALVTALRAGLA